MSFPPPSALVIDYFAEVCDAFEQAERAGGGRVTRHYQIGSHAVEFNFAGPGLVPLISPAFEHLPGSGEAQPNLQVLLWDGESTGVEMPAPPCGVEDFVRNGEIWRFADQRFRIIYHPRSNTYNFLDLENNLAIYQAGMNSRLPQYESGSPLLQILEWWFDIHEEYILHAGAVGTSEAGVLLVGKGGSGKSTTVLACLNSDLCYVGDDYCLLTDSNKPYVASLYNSAKIYLGETSRFPFLEMAISPLIFPDSEKALYFMKNYQTSKLLRGFPVRAVLIPKVTGLVDTRLRQASPAQALLALAPSTVFHFPGTENRAIKRMGTLVKEVPCYFLELGTDLSTIADSILMVLR